MTGGLCYWVKSPSPECSTVGDSLSRLQQEPVFHTGKTYLYGYESFILHGLPSRGLAMAGVRLTCKLEITYVSHSDHLLQIRSPKLEEYNGFWPTDPFTASSRLTETIAACFSQAFKFEYTDGRVGSIFAPEDCPILCTNLVRGILNMMQITIKKSQNVYELQEAGIEGICQTRYVIQDDSKNNCAIISKSKDLMDCQEKAVKNMGMAYIRPCPTCPLVRKVRNVKGTVIFTYKMKYDGSGALMTSAMSEQVYQISPFNEPDGAAVMEARQELSLVDIKRTPISAPKTQLQNQGSLRYHFSGELLQMPIPLIRIKNTDLQLTETLQQLVQNNEEGATKEASTKFLQMVQLFRIVTLDQIESLWMQFANDLPYRHWFLSAICAAGATDTFRFLKQKIHDEKLNIWEAAATLPLAFHFVTPNKQTLEVASTFLTCPQIQKAPLHRVIVYLGYGSMVNKYCAQTSLCPNELLQPLHNLATEATSKSDAKDMALALKAIGNAGEPASIKRILKFLPTFSPAAASLPNRIHANAMLALRKIARKDPVKVREIALQVFMDNTLAPNVRMVACVVLFETKPGLPTVTAMAISLLTEPSLQVASFTYSHMKALAVGRIPQLYNLSAACNIAIKLLSPRLDRLSYRYSKVIHVGDYSFEYQAGAIWRVYLMNSPSTMFPSDIITKVRGYYANTATDIIEVALQSQGLTKLIRKQNIPFAEYDTYRTLKELGKTLLGWKELPPEDPLVSAYVKVLGQEIASVDIDKDAIQQIMMSLTGSSNWQPVVKKVVEEVQRGISGQWTLPAMVGELRHIVPTVVGVPLELSLCGVALAQAAADVDIQISPPLSDNFRPSQLLETKMDIHADIKPKAYFHMIAMMGINTQYFQSGLEFHAEFSANTTMKFDAKINMKEKNLKIETPPCHQEVELAAVRSEVYAISRNMEEIDYEKKSQLLPKGEVPSISNEPFQPSESSSRPGTWKLEIQAGSKAASKVIDVASSGPKEEDETSLYEDIQAKLKKILGIENVFQVANKTRRRKKRIQSKEKIAVMDLWAKPSASPLSSSSSSSTASSADDPLTYYLFSQANLPVYRFWFKPADKQDPGREVLNCSISSSSSSVSGEGISRATSQGSLKWGEDCQDYQIATQIATGQYAAYPAMQVKLEWPKVPSIVRTTARWFYSFLPGAAYVLGYSQRQQHGPSHWATLVMALTSPRTCDVVLKLPELTIYDRAIRLPLPFPSSPGTPISKLPSSDRNVFSQAMLSVIENLKARCSVFQNTITTFNGVEFNYSMPANCYHVLVQDCSPELKFLVMMKRLEESADLTEINVRLASQCKHADQQRKGRSVTKSPRLWHR
ncbi:vitellogenin-2-like [Buteo buteo]|uniref:vitellogenin-2-like n=1 Tax=Buteo buteo TaxID=30397 RepID=UPI003EBE0D92